MNAMPSVVKPLVLINGNHRKTYQNRVHPGNVEYGQRVNSDIDIIGLELVSRAIRKLVEPAYRLRLISSEVLRTSS